MDNVDDSEFLNVFRRKLEVIERVADEVLLLRNTLVELDKKRQQIREAGSTLEKTTSTEDRFVLINGMFVKIPHAEAKDYVRTEFAKINKQIEEHRVTLKKQVENLMKLQNADEQLAGFGLEALSKADKDSLKAWI